MTALLAEAETEVAVLAGLPGAMGRALGMPIATCWLPRRGGMALVAGAVWHDRAAGLAAYARTTRATELARGEGAAGTALAEGGVVRDDHGTLRDPRRHARIASGLDAACAVPVVVDGDTIAVLEAHAGEGESPAPFADALAGLAAHVALDLWRRRQRDRFAAVGAEADAAFEAFPLGLALLDAGHRISRVNDALVRLLGVPREALVVLRLDQVLEDGEQYRVAARAALEPAGGSYRARHRLIPAGDRRRWVSVTVAPLRDGGDLLAQVEDVTRAVERERRLRHLSEHDDLTGLANRRGFERDLARAVAVTRRHGRPAALLLLDLDGFKRVNDDHGHAVGDEVLSRVAAALRRRVRRSDVTARLGGDEFVVLLEDSPPEAAARLAADVADAIAAIEVPAPAGPVRVSASVGIAPIDTDADPAGVLAAADAAMYRRKRAGQS